MNEKTITANKEKTLKIVEKLLSDGSSVYNIHITSIVSVIKRPIIMECRDLNSAINLYNSIIGNTLNY